MDPIQQPIQPPVQIPDFQPKQNYLKTIIFSVLGIILLTSIVFLYQQNQKLQKQVLNQRVSPTIKVPSPTSKTTSSISLTPDETTGWKTFSDELSEVQFKYPTEYITSKYTVDGNRVVGVAEIKIIGEDLGPEPALITVSYWNNQNLLSLADFQKNIDAEGGMIYVLYDQSKEIASQATIGNKTGYYIQKSNCEPFTCSKYVISSGNKIFEIKLFPSSNKHLNVINQILSTFHFLK